MNLSKRSLVYAVSALALLALVCVALALVLGRGSSVFSLHNPFGIGSSVRTGESLFLQDSSRVHYSAGRGHFLRGRYGEAEKELRLAADADPGSPEPHDLLSQVLLLRCQSSPSDSLLAAAVASGERAVSLDPGRPAFHYNLGSLYARAGRASDAMREYQSALQADSTFLPAYRDLGKLCRQQGRFDDARSIYERGLRLDPDDPDLLYGQGTVLEHAGLLQEAAGVYRKAAVIDSGRADVHLNLGKLLMRLGDAALGEEEIARFERLRADDVAALATQADANPNDSALLLRLATAHARARHWAAAETAYRRVLALSPNLGEPVAGLAAVYRDSYQEAKAESLLAEGLQRFPNHPLLCEQQALLALARRQYPDAVRLFGDLSRRFPGRGDLYLSLGRAEAANGDLRASLGHIQRARLLLPDRRDLLIDLAEVYYRLGNAAEAVTTAEQAAQFNPRSPKAYMILGTAYAATGRSSDAARASQRAALLRQSATYSVGK